MQMQKQDNKSLFNLLQGQNVSRGPCNSEIS